MECCTSFEVVAEVVPLSPGSQAGSMCSASSASDDGDQGASTTQQLTSSADSKPILSSSSSAALLVSCILLQQALSLMVEYACSNSAWRGQLPTIGRSVQQCQVFADAGLSCASLLVMHPLAEQCTHPLTYPPTTLSPSAGVLPERSPARPGLRR